MGWWWNLKIMVISILMYRCISQSEESGCVWTHSNITWHHLYCVFVYIYSFLIEKDLHKCWNISVKFPCALLVYLYLSLEDLFVFSVRIFPLYSYFCKLKVYFIMLPLYWCNSHIDNLLHIFDILLSYINCNCFVIIYSRKELLHSTQYWSINFCANI